MPDPFKKILNYSNTFVTGSGTAVGEINMEKLISKIFAVLAIPDWIFG